MDASTLRRTLLLATAAVVAAGIAVAVVISARQGASAIAAAGLPQASSPSAPASGQSAEAAGAPSGSGQDALAAAADALGFRQATATNVGLVEDLPPDAPLLAPSASLLPVGAAAPDFSLSTATGRSVRLSDYRGKTILLEFFATWCPHCQAEVGHLVKIHGSLPPERFAFLSVNADSEDPASLYAFDRFFKIPWPTLLDPGSPRGSYKQAGGAGPVTRAYGVALYPTFYVIDARGKVAWRNDREQPDLLIIQKLRDASGN